MDKYLVKIGSEHKAYRGGAWVSVGNSVDENTFLREGMDEIASLAVSTSRVVVPLKLPGIVGGGREKKATVDKSLITLLGIEVG